MCHHSCNNEEPDNTPINPLVAVVAVIWFAALLGTFIIKNSDAFFCAAVTSVLYGIGYLIYKK